MKKKSILASALLLAVTTVLLLHGCFKDTGTRQYKVYTPVLQTSAQVRASVKSDLSQPIVNAGKMYVLGNTIFLCEKEKGIHIIDNSNPASPINKAFINIPGNEDIAVKDNFLYADCYTDLLIIDISNPNAVVLKNYAPNLFPGRRYVNGYFVDSGKVITTWTVRDTIANLQIQQGQGIWNNGSFIVPMMYGGYLLTASSNASVATQTGVAGSMSKLAIVQDHLFAVDQDLLLSISIASPANPNYQSNKNLHLGIGTAETIFPFQDKLFIGSTSGMYIFSISNPDNPALLSTFSHARVCDPVITDGINAYITLHAGTFCGGIENELDVVNVQNISSPYLVKKYTLTKPMGLSKDGNTLMICDAGLKVYDATDPNNLQLKQTINIADAYDVICINGIAIVSAKDGLYQYDYSNLSNVKLLSKLSITL